ncbi:hypothetical protein [Kitasatospora sp. NPDC085879]
MSREDALEFAMAQMASDGLLSVKDVAADIAVSDEAGEADRMPWLI